MPHTFPPPPPTHPPTPTPPPTLSPSLPPRSMSWTAAPPSPSTAATRRTPRPATPTSWRQSSPGWRPAPPPSSSTARRWAGTPRHRRSCPSRWGAGGKGEEGKGGGIGELACKMGVVAQDQARRCRRGVQERLPLSPRQDPCCIPTPSAHVLVLACLPALLHPLFALLICVHGYHHLCTCLCASLYRICIPACLYMHR
jgi:hypothetical protein